MFVYEEGYNWLVKIEKLKKLIKGLDGRFGWQLEGCGCYLIDKWNIA